MKGIAKKLAAVMSVIEHPERSEYVKFGDFHYATRDDIFECTRRALVEQGLVWVPAMRCVNVEPTGKETSKGDKIFRVGVEVRITWIDTDTGETLETEWSGESFTHDERGAQAAATQAVRFALTNMFMLLDGYDVEQPTARQSGGAAEENTHREKATPEDPAQAIVDRLYEVGCSDDQVAEFGAWLAGMEDVDDIMAIPETRMLTWYERVTAYSDKELADKVMDAIGTDDAAA